jgi:V/A-type H+-transporting ATPase subunit I
MLKPAKMQKVRIIGLRAQLSSVCSFLQGIGAVDVREVKSEHLSKEKPLEYFDSVSAQLVRMRGIRSALSPHPMPPSPLTVGEPLELASALDVDEVIKEITARAENSKKRVAQLEAQAAELGGLLGLDFDFSNLGADSLDFHLLRTDAKKLAAFEERLSEITKDYQIAAGSPSKGGAAIAAILAIRKGVEFAHAAEGLALVSALPKISAAPSDAIGGIRQEIYAEKEALLSAQGELESISAKYYPIVVMLEEALSIEADRAAVASQFGRTKSLFFAEGWAVAGKESEIAHALSLKFGKKAMLQKIHTGHDEMPPTLLTNPKFAGPFQSFIEFLSLPQATEIDPTLILLLTIPLTYALIFGDAGYALVSLLLALIMVWKSKNGTLTNMVGKIWAISAVPAMIMGIVFDEYFAFSHSALLGLSEPLYHGFHRVKEMQTLMLIVLVIGMLHIGLGFLLGAANEWNHNRKHAYAKLAWLGLEASGIALVMAYLFNALPANAGMAAAVGFGACTFVIVWAEGVVGIFEIPGLSSNIMSYIRIAAVGVGGVIIAEAINELLLPSTKNLNTVEGILLFAIMSAAYLMMHLAAIVLAMFESLIHGARLSVVEFFGKFYHGNGRAFAPFAARRVYTKD